MFTLQLSHPDTCPSLCTSIYFIGLSDRPPALPSAALLEEVERLSRGGLEAAQQRLSTVAGTGRHQLSAGGGAWCRPHPWRWYLPAWVPSGRSSPLGTASHFTATSASAPRRKSKQQGNSPTHPTSSCAPLYPPFPPHL